MKAVIQVDEEALEERRAKGLDRFDETWEGVLHMTPAPAREHQRIVGGMFKFLSSLLERRGRGILELQINVFNEASPQEDYRIPDLTFVAADRQHVLAKDGIRGGPDAVIEVRSPNDETYDKLPFYAALGVREAIVVDRDTKRVELFRLSGAQYVAAPVDPDGWLRSEALGVRFTTADGPHLLIEDVDESTNRAQI